jgi:hypothetical protein
MAKYRNKENLEIVEAVQFDSSKLPWPEYVLSWTFTESVTGKKAPDDSRGYLQTRYGEQHIYDGDWIVSEPNNWYFLVKDALFRVEYEPVETYLPSSSFVSIMPLDERTTITYTVTTPLSVEQLRALIAEELTKSEERIVQRVLEELHKPDPRAKYD